MNPKSPPVRTTAASDPVRVLSPRKRRLRWTVLALVAVTIVGSAIATALYWKSRPKPYRPDESNADITSTLARGLPKNAPKADFEDVTASAGLQDFRNFQGARASQLPEDMGPGLAWGDFNNDGLEDLFVVSAGGPLNAPEPQLAPCALYQNLGNGKFKRVDLFPQTRIHGMAAAWGDYDQDGYLDLIVTGYNTTLLFHNDGGTGKFTRDPRFPNLKGFWSGATWGDYDNDRCLDLYICGYVQFEENQAEHTGESTQFGTFVPFTLNPSSYQPAKNRLFHNNGDGTFTDVSEALGVTDPDGRSLSALWHDFDNDGWLDLYVANDVSKNVFYHNLGGRFEEISDAALVAEYRSAMGLAAGDYDRDGDDDLFITHWVGQENALFNNLWHDLQDAARTNHLASVPKSFLRFMDLADMRGLGQIAIPFVGWGTEFADFDNDGWLDLIVANGSTLESEGPPPKKLVPQEPFLFWNDKGQFFYNIASSSKALSEKHVSRGLAVCDFDNDGALDIAIAQLGEGVQLIRNKMRGGNWLKLQLKSLTKAGKPIGFGDGARVLLRLGTNLLQRTVSSASYLSQSSHVVHFGLGSAAMADSVEVHWLGGGTNIYARIPANSTWQLVENNSVPKRVDPARPANSSSLPPAIGNSDSKSKVLDFWSKQRAAMNAMKVEKDFAKAIPLFRQALAIDPRHEDAHYYLAQSLAHTGEVPEALQELQSLIQINPQSHRAHQQWGAIRANHSSSKEDLAAAESALLRAHQLNPEETGALLLLGQIALWQGKNSLAQERLFAACRTNPKAALGFFLLGLLDWDRGNAPLAGSHLQDARQALGPEWKPKGATAEGDVQQKRHEEEEPLAFLWSDWNGSTNASEVYPGRIELLREKQRRLP